MHYLFQFICPQRPLSWVACLLLCVSARNLPTYSKNALPVVAGTITVEYLIIVFTARLPVLGNTRQILDASSKSEQF